MSLCSAVVRHLLSSRFGLPTICAPLSGTSLSPQNHELQVPFLKHLSGRFNTCILFQFEGIQVVLDGVVDAETVIAAESKYIKIKGTYIIKGGQRVPEAMLDVSVKSSFRHRGHHAQLKLITITTPSYTHDTISAISIIVAAVVSALLLSYLWHQ